MYINTLYTYKWVHGARFCNMILIGKSKAMLMKSCYQYFQHQINQKNGLYKLIVAEWRYMATYIWVRAGPDGTEPLSEKALTNHHWDIHLRVIWYDLKFINYKILYIYIYIATGPMSWKHNVWSMGLLYWTTTLYSTVIIKSLWWLQEVLRDHEHRNNISCRLHTFFSESLNESTCERDMKMPK